MVGLDARIRRWKLKKSQFEISVETGIPNYVISKFENDRATLTPEQLERLKTALHLNEGDAA